MRFQLKSFKFQVQNGQLETWNLKLKTSISVPESWLRCPLRCDLPRAAARPRRDPESARACRRAGGPSRGRERRAGSRRPRGAPHRGFLDRLERLLEPLADDVDSPRPRPPRRAPGSTPFPAREPSPCSCSFPRRPAPARARRGARAGACPGSPVRPVSVEGDDASGRRPGPAPAHRARARRSARAPRALRVRRRVRALRRRRARPLPEPSPRWPGRAARPPGAPRRSPPPRAARARPRARSKPARPSASILRAPGRRRRSRAPGSCASRRAFSRSAASSVLGLPQPLDRGFGVRLALLPPLPRLSQDLACAVAAPPGGMPRSRATESARLRPERPGCSR